MKRGYAIPCGLLLFALAVASFVTSRPASPVVPPSRIVVAPASAAVELAQNDGYVPPLLAIFDDEEAATPGPMAALSAVSFEEPRMLPAEILRQTDWPSAQPDLLVRVGFDNPPPQPFSPIPKTPGQFGQSSTIMPDLDTQGSFGSSNQAPTLGVSTRAPENLIRPKPLSIESPNSMARFQGQEPPLAGNANLPAPTPFPAAQAPQMAVPQAVPTPGPAPIQPVPANLSEYTGCGCEPKVGTGCGCSSRVVPSCGYSCVQQIPLCCQSFSTCCQPCVRCYDVVESPCCGGGDSHWRPFAKLRNWFRGEQKGGGSCGPWDECVFAECGSARKPLFSRFRGLFHKTRNGDGIYLDSYEVEYPSICGCGH